MLTLLAVLASMATVPEASPPPKDADPIVCKRDQTSDVGTHMRPKPVCMKRSEWDYVERKTQYELHSLQDRSSFDPGRAEGHGPAPQ